MAIVQKPATHSVSVSSSSGQVSVRGCVHTAASLHKPLAFAVLEALRGEMRRQIRDLVPMIPPHTPLRTKELECVPFIITCTRAQKTFNDALKLAVCPFSFAIESQPAVHGTIDLMFGEDCTADCVLEYMEWLCVELRHHIVTAGHD